MRILIEFQIAECRKCFVEKIHTPFLQLHFYPELSAIQILVGAELSLTYLILRETSFKVIYSLRRPI